MPDTLADWRLEQRFVSLGDVVWSTTRDVLIDGVAHGVVDAWGRTPRPKLTWPRSLGTIRRCSGQGVCKRRSANQCVTALAIQPAASRKSSLADAVQKRVLSDGGWHRCLRAFDDTAWQHYATRCPTSWHFTTCLYHRGGSKPRHPRPLATAVVAVFCEVFVGHCGLAPSTSACEHSVKLSRAQRGGVSATWFYMWLSAQTLGWQL